MSLQTPSSRGGHLALARRFAQAPGLPVKLLKEKSALDAKLAEGTRAQLDATREALLKLQSSRAVLR